MGNRASANATGASGRPAEPHFSVPSNTALGFFEFALIRWEEEIGSTSPFKHWM